MQKNILCIGLETASSSTQEKGFLSKVSLLDWDIVLFRPSIKDIFYYQTDKHMGKTCLDDTDSFKMKESCEHWRREIKQAIEAGKSVIVFLPPLEEFYIATGERKYSGTGRNQKTTRLVTLYNNYNSLPISLAPVNATGSSMKLVTPTSEILTAYWSQFNTISKYKVLITLGKQHASIVTKTGDKEVGGIYRSKTSKGALVLLPDIDFYQDGFFDEVGSEQSWSTEGKKFATQLISSVIALDKALRSAIEATPEPDWAADKTFMLASEYDLKSELLDAERQVEEAQRRKENVQERLAAAGRLRALLYEKGKPLENAIIEALRLFGFSATQYRQGDSEFDVVFECSEGRLLGEAEGKDSKAINIDKLRQLSMNIHEDLLRDEVIVPAKGVLFGNGYRFLHPDKRDVQFTEKCITASRASSTALLATTAMYSAVQYLTAFPDDQSYAQLCRTAILTSNGLVTLPSRPAPDCEPSPDAIALQQTDPV